MWNQLISQMLTSAQAGDYDNVDRTCIISDAKTLTDQDLLSSFSLTLNCTEFKENPKDKAYFRPVAIPRVEAIYQEFLSRIEAKTITPSTQHYSDAIGALKAAIGEIKTVGMRNQTVPANWLSDAESKLTALDQRSASPTSARTSKASPSTLSSPVVAAPTPASSTPKSNPEKATAPADFKDDLQCLYAGFVIPKGPTHKCQPFKELPFASEFFDLKTFVCPQSEQILCNPLLFGYEDTNCKVTEIKDCTGKRPICVYRSQDATKNCFDQAKRKKTLKQTMEIWKSPEGEKLYRDYVESLENLCDQTHLEKRKLRTAVYNDITKTCEVAFSVFKENVGSEYLPSKISPTEKGSGKR
jgi:hypothetical protein